MNPDDRRQRRRRRGAYAAVLSATAGAALAAAMIPVGLAYADTTDDAFAVPAASIGGSEGATDSSESTFLDNAGASSQYGTDETLTNNFITQLTNDPNATSGVVSSFEQQLTTDLNTFTPGGSGTVLSTDTALDGFLIREGIAGDFTADEHALNTDILAPLAEVNGAAATGLETDLTTIFNDLGLTIF